MTPIADQHAAIAWRLAEIEAASRLVGALPSGITISPPQQTELTADQLATEALRAKWRNAP